MNPRFGRTAEMPALPSLGVPSCDGGTVLVTEVVVLGSRS